MLIQLSIQLSQRTDYFNSHEREGERARERERERERERADPCLDRLLLFFWAHYIQDCHHLLCTGSL